MSDSIHPTISDRQHRTAQANRLRRQLTDVWGKPIRGLPRGMDLLQAMDAAGMDRDISYHRPLYDGYRTLCRQLAASLRTCEVWGAPDSMATWLAAHPTLNRNSLILGPWIDRAGFSRGLVHFPVPVQLKGVLPIHGLFWQLDEDETTTALMVQTIAETAAVEQCLPPQLRASVKFPASELCPNSVSVVARGQASTVSDPRSFGALAPDTAIALALAFWELRASTTPEPGAAPEPDTAPEASADPWAQEATVTVFDTPAVSKRKRNRKRAPQRRAIRIIEEPATAPHAPETNADTEHRPQGTMQREMKWHEDTNRWKVSERKQYRCPDPSRHRSIIEAGGTCEKVLVTVKEHLNGPKGRPVDDRDTVRLIAGQPNPATSTEDPGERK